MSHTNPSPPESSSHLHTVRHIETPEEVRRYTAHAQAPTFMKVGDELITESPKINAGATSSSQTRVIRHPVSERGTPTSRDTYTPTSGDTYILSGGTLGSSQLVSHESAARSYPMRSSTQQGDTALRSSAHDTALAQGSTTVRSTRVSEPSTRTILSGAVHTPTRTSTQSGSSAYSTLAAEGSTVGSHPLSTERTSFSPTTRYLKEQRAESTIPPAAFKKEEMGTLASFQTGVSTPISSHSGARIGAHQISAATTPHREEISTISGSATQAAAPPAAMEKITTTTTETTVQVHPKLLSQPGSAATLQRISSATVPTTSKQITAHDAEKEQLSSAENMLPRPLDECIPSVNLQSVNVGHYTFRLPAFEDELLATLDPLVHTVFDAWLRTVYYHSQKPAFAYRKREGDKLSKEFASLTYADAEECISLIASGIINLNLPAGPVGLFSENRAEWQLVNLALARLGSWVLTPLEPKQADEELQYIMSHSEMETVFVSARNFERLVRLCAAQGATQKVRNFVCLDELTADNRGLPAQIGFKELRVFSLMDLYSEGQRQTRRDFDHPSASDPYLIDYTSSGTTAQKPKGVIITHGNIIAASAAIRLMWKEIALEESGAQQKFLSFLPLSHVLQLVSEQVMMESGVEIGYWSNDMKLLTEDIALFSPSLMTSLPAALHKMEEKLEQGVKKTNFIARAFVKLAMRSSSGPQSVLGKIWDKLVFSRLRAHAGIPNLHLILSGCAPLSDDTQSYLHKALNIPVLQGYGRAETCGVSAMQLRGDDCTDCIGAPMPCCELRLESVPDLGYTVNDEPHPRGELLIRGFNVSPGFYKDTESTMTSFVNGFFRSGDIAEQLDNGSFRILGHKSNLKVEADS